MCNSRTRAARIVQDLANLGLTAYFSEDFENEMLEGTIMVTYGSLHKGFEYPLLRFVVIAENDIFASRQKKREKKKKYDGKSIAGFNELNIGDFVVHESHGLGVYKGIEKLRLRAWKRIISRLNTPETVTFMCWRHSLTVCRNMRRRIPKRSRNSISWGHRSGIKQNQGTRCG